MNKKQLIVACAMGILLAVSIIMPLYADEIIKDIQEKFSAINNTKSYKEVTKDLMDRSTEGGELVGYFKGDELRKITAFLYGEMGKLVEEYYFWEGNLIFVFQQYEAYLSPIGTDLLINFKNPIDDRIGRIEEYRLYFKDNKLIRRIKKLIDGQGSQEEEMQKDDPVYQKAEDHFIKEAQDFIKILGSK